MDISGCCGSRNGGGTVYEHSIVDENCASGHHINLLCEERAPKRSTKIREFPTMKYSRITRKTNSKPSFSNPDVVMRLNTSN